MLNRLEYEGIVVDNVDPLAKGRLRIFIFGMHDISGLKIPVNSLPWAFSTYSSNVLSVPEVGTVVKVKFKLDDSGRNPYNPQYIEWYPTSHHNKLKSVKDPRNFILYDENSKKFFDSLPNYLSPEDLEKIQNQIGELELLKKEKQSQLEQNKKDLQQLDQENDVVDLLTQNSELETEESEELKRYDTQLKSLNEKYNSTYRYSQITFANSGYNNFDDWLNFNTQEVSQSILELNKTHRENIDSFYNRRLSITSKINNVQNNNLNESKKSIQKDIDSLSKEIQNIDSQIENLSSSKPSGKVSLDSFEIAKSIDSRITRLDETTGKIYGYKQYDEFSNASETVIGNWNGAYCYIPGYAGQSGDPIWKQKTNAFIKTESRLSPVDPFALNRENITTNIANNNPSIVAADANKTWNCDISYETRMKILSKRNAVLNAVKWLRDQLFSLFSATSNSAIGQYVKAAIKQLTAILKATQKFLKFVNDVILEIAKITAQIRQLINWILSLPVRLLVLLQDCLTHFFNSIGSSLSGSFSFGSSNIEFSEVTELINQAQKTFKTATETVEATTIVYTEIKAIQDTVEKV